MHSIFALLVILDDEIGDFKVYSPSLDWKHLKDKDQAFFCHCKHRFGAVPDTEAKQEFLNWTEDMWANEKNE